MTVGVGDSFTKKSVLLLVLLWSNVFRSGAVSIPRQAQPTLSSSFAAHRGFSLSEESLSARDGIDRREQDPTIDGFVETDSMPSRDLVNSKAIEEAIAWRSSRPCCVSLGESRHDCFFRIVRETISHLTKYKDQKPKWENLGGPSTSDIGCTSWGPSHIFVYYLAPNQTVLARTSEKDTWSHWEELPMPTLQETPLCLAIKPGMVHCIGRTWQGTAAAALLNGGRWRAKKVPTQHLASTIGCVLPSHSREDCFATGIDNEMKHIRWTRSTGWQSWESLGGSCNGAPSPVITKKDRIEVFVNSSMGRLAYISGHNGQWTRWKLFNLWGSPLATDATCVPSTNDRIDCFAAFQPDGRMHRISWDGFRWSRWKVYSYNLYDKPLCRFFEDQRIWCLLLASPMKWSVAAFDLIPMPT